MMDKKLEILKYETGEHHRQKLRAQIDQNMIDKIQISQSPSSNYYQAYKNLYQEELQKSVDLHANKKSMEAYKKSYDQHISNEHSRIYPNRDSFNSMENSRVTNHSLTLNNTITADKTKNLNYRDVDYQDYDMLKETKALEHTFKNYNGGEKFYESQDRHLQRQMVDLHNMRMTLTKQLNGKQEQKNKEWLVKKEEELAMKEKELRQRSYDMEVNRVQKDERKRHCDVIKEQMQEERVRRGRKSLFNYDHMTRHNPITNPIEYHIDNPYILKQMQNTRGHSQLPR